MRQREGLLCFAFGMVALTGPSCIGTETDNPVVDFDRTPCKAGGGGGGTQRAASVMRSSAALTLQSGDYAGLQCFAWEALESGRLRIDVFNFTGSCHVDWQLGTSQLEGGKLELSVQNEECAIAGCGSCLYDFTFEVERVQPGAPLPLQLHKLDCDGDPTGEVALTLPLDQRTEGVLCREANQASPSPPFACGLAFTFPCGMGAPARCSEPRARCAEGLVCDPRPQRRSDVCLDPCESDADCPLAIEFCDAGACRLRETF